MLFCLSFKVCCFDSAAKVCVLLRQLLSQEVSCREGARGAEVGAAAAERGGGAGRERGALRQGLQP